MAPTVQSLASILSRAKERCFVMEDIPWEQQLETGKLFIPEIVTPLKHTPFYERLTVEERLTYNHYAAMAVSEQFCYLESELLTKVIGALLRRDKKKLDGDLALAMEGFIEEEFLHTEVFRRLNRISWPEIYESADYYFVRPGVATGITNWLVRRWPHFLMGWVWMALALEEKTIAISREYENKAESTVADTDGLYRLIHRLHARDEVRHVQLDQHVLRYLYKGAPEWRKRFNTRLVARSLRSFTTPRLKSTRVNVLLETVKRHSRLKRWEHEMVAAITGLYTNDAYQSRVWGRGTLPITFRLLDGVKDMDEVCAAFPSYKEME